MRILIAEDSEADVYLIREALRAAGLNFEAETASNGEVVMAILQKPDVSLDALILDLNLITHGGIEILQMVRAQPNLAHIPVVILTSSESPIDRQLAHDLGADAYVHKAMDLDEFLRTGKQIAQLFTSRCAAAAK